MKALPGRSYWRWCELKSFSCQKRLSALLFALRSQNASNWMSLWKRVSLMLEAAAKLASSSTRSIGKCLSDAQDAMAASFLFIDFQDSCWGFRKSYRRYSGVAALEKWWASTSKTRLNTCRHHSTCHLLWTIFIGLQMGKEPQLSETDTKQVSCAGASSPQERSAVAWNLTTPCWPNYSTTTRNAAWETRILLERGQLAWAAWNPLGGMGTVFIGSEASFEVWPKNTRDKVPVVLHGWSKVLAATALYKCSRTCCKILEFADEVSTPSLQESVQAFWLNLLEGSGTSESCQEKLSQKGVPNACWDTTQF